jgi:hypothetical protein
VHTSNTCWLTPYPNGIHLGDLELCVVLSKSIFHMVEWRLGSIIGRELCYITRLAELEEKQKGIPVILDRLRCIPMGLKKLFQSLNSIEDYAVQMDALLPSTNSVRAITNKSLRVKSEHPERHQFSFFSLGKGEKTSRTYLTTFKLRIPWLL